MSRDIQRHHYSQVMSHHASRHLGKKTKAPASSTLTKTCIALAPWHRISKPALTIFRLVPKWCGSTAGKNGTRSLRPVMSTWLGATHPKWNGRCLTVQPHYQRFQRRYLPPSPSTPSEHPIDLWATQRYQKFDLSWKISQNYTPNY